MSTVNRVWPTFIGAAVVGAVDVSTTQLVVYLVDDSFVFDATDDSVADISSAVVAGPVDLAGSVTVSAAGVLSTDEPTTSVSGVPAATDVAGVVLALDGATDADRVLVCCWQRQSDTTPVAVIADGGDLDVSFPSGVVARF